MAKPKSLIRFKIYTAPPRAEINQFARDVCQALGKTLQEDFSAPQLWIDLATFIEVVASICAKQMNDNQS